MVFCLSGPHQVGNRRIRQTWRVGYDISFAQNHLIHFLHLDTEPEISNTRYYPRRQFNKKFKRIEYQHIWAGQEAAEPLKQLSSQLSRFEGREDISDFFCLDPSRGFNLHQGRESCLVGGISGHQPHSIHETMTMRKPRLPFICMVLISTCWFLDDSRQKTALHHINNKSEFKIICFKKKQIKTLHYIQYINLNMDQC